MATYVNDLRLKEISTGDESGTWGTSTNTNLELIGEALGYATQQVFSSDADATTTVADGASDPARAMYFKITSAGSLTATRTCTIAPNTVSRVMFIENATTGSQSIAISQGSGANVTIATGKTAVVYLDGAGSGAAVVDAMAGVDPGVTDTLTEVLVAGNTSGGTNIELTTTDKVQFRDSAIYINSSADGQLDLVADTEIQIAATTIDVNGTLAFDSLKGTGATTVTNILDEDNMASDSATAIATQQSIKAYVDSQVGSFDTLAEVLAQGNTTGGTNIAFGDNDKATFGAGSDLQIYHDGSHSYITDSGTGNLNILANEFALYEGNGTDLMIGATPNGAVTLSHDATTKLATTATGIDVTGDATFPDNGKAIFGADSDFKVYHSGATGLIENYTGSLFITNASDDFDVVIQSDNGAGSLTDYFRADGSAGSALLYHYGSQKLATTTSGIDVTGDIVLGDNNPTITMNDSSVVNLQHLITSSSDNLIIAADNNDVDANTKIEFYVDGSQRMNVAPTGIDVTGTVTTDGLTSQIATTGRSTLATFQNSASLSAGNQATIELKNGGQTAFISAESIQANTGIDLLFSSNNSSGTETNKLRIAEDGDISFYDDAAAQGLFWDSSASALGLGTTIPGQKLEIKESSAGAGDAIIRLRGDGNNANNTPLGSLEWFNTDASGPQPGVVAAVEAQSANANGHMGKLLFKTHDGSGSEADPPTTRMTIDASGNVGIGISPAHKLSIFGTGAGNATVQIEGEGGADPYINFLANNTQHWSLGVDDSDADKFKLSEHSALGTNDYFVVDVTGNVGIGESNPSNKLHVTQNVDALLAIEVDNQNTGASSAVGLYLNGQGNNFYLKNYGDGTSNANITEFVSTASGSQFVFVTASQEAMRIDGSGNLLVGKTSTGAATAGIELNGANDLLRIARDGGVLQELNLIGGTGGDIIEFRKDNSAVGSIGVASSDNMYITASATNHVGLYLGGGGVLPMNSGSLDTGDNVDIGSPNYQFADLYLAGGAYLGGTVAANKLDDYEEGTWTPVYAPATGSFASVTMDSAETVYTKVGRMVTVSGIIRTDAIDVTGGSGAAIISGLPFPVAHWSAISLGRVQGFGGDMPDSGYGGGNAYNINLYYRSTSNGATSALNVTDLADGTSDNANYIFLEYTYQTNT